MLTGFFSDIAARSQGVISAPHVGFATTTLNS